MKYKKWDDGDWWARTVRNDSTLYGSLLAGYNNHTIELCYELSRIHIGVTLTSQNLGLYFGVVHIVINW